MNGNWPWLLWIGGTLATFLALELPAIHAHPEDTLSARLRAWLGISPSRPVRHAAVPLFIAGILALPVWLIAHLLG